ncbi:Uncharacterised protein [Mycobacterium tuberculosis]|nr:Uncharacterised protein [Mycobacterium tuberculosis]
MLHFPGIVPALTQLTAAADMRLSINKTAIQQAQPVGIEIRIHTGTIRAITFNQQRIMSS